MRDTDFRLDRLKSERDHAYAKAAEWTAKGKELDRRITEVENLEILRVVRGLTASPEDLRSVLDMIQAVKPQQPPGAAAQKPHEQSTMEQKPIPQERKEDQ